MAEHDEFDRNELVNAYLDGEVSADERVRVEADPALMAEVEQLRRLRTALADVAPPPEATRERAIAAALAHFDEQADAPTAPSASSKVVPLAGRRATRWMKAVSAAAAAAVLVVGGFLIASRPGDDDADDAAQVRATDAAGAATEEEPAAAPAIAESATTTSPPATTTSRLAAADTAVEAEMADAPMIAAAEPTGSTETAADTRQVVRNPDDLAALAETLDETPALVEDIIADCEGGRPPAADATFEDADGIAVDIVVAGTADGYAAVSVDDCTILLRAPDPDS
jgi:hypothetical protein